MRIQSRKIVVFSVKRSDALLPDPNPILDEGAPTSTGGTENAATLCDILGTPLVLESPRDRYYHGWGEECLNPKLIVASWTLHVQDVEGKPTAFTFELVEGTSPLILGMDVRKYSNTFNLSDQKYIEMRRPTDSAPRTLFTYIVPNDDRLRLEVAPHPLATVSTLLGNVHTTAKRTPLVFCKRIHRYTDAHPDELRNICKDAGIMDNLLDDAITRVSEACQVCCKNGRSKPSRKVSLSHVNAAFNEEIQVDFLFVNLKGQNIVILIITDTGTGYSELIIAENRTAQVIVRVIEQSWVCRHGAPKALSADDEYNRRPILDYLRTHEIQFKARPARRHNKTGIVERKIGVVKSILYKLNDEVSTAAASSIVARAAFLSNLFSGNRLLSSFELARGFSPSIIGIPPSVVPQELLEAHREQVAIRALQRIAHSRAPAMPHSEIFSPGTPVWVFYRTTKQNEKDGWVEATIVEATEYFVLARRSQRGPPMRVAYEDLRLAPRNKLTKELLSCSLEDELQALHDVRHPTMKNQCDRDISKTASDSTLPAQDSPLRLRPRLKPDNPETTQAIPVPDEEPPTVPLATCNKDFNHCENAETNSVASADIHSNGGDRVNYDEEFISTKHHGSLLTTSGLRGPQKDIGEYAESVSKRNPDMNTSLKTDKHHVMSTIYETIGSKQVTARHLDFAPSWVLDEAFRKEHDSSWKGAYKEIPKCQVPRSANVITSHTVYKVKTQEDGSKDMKARIVPHGNRDNEKDNIRKDSSTAQLFVIRLLLSLATFLGFRIACADIKGAYLQSGPIRRDIYVRPPKEHRGPRGVLWKLLKLPYGIFEAGRQWQKTVETWMFNEASLERVLGVSQLFVKRDKYGRVVLLVAKVTDDFLLGGSIDNMKAFLDNLKQRFIVGKIAVDQKMYFDGCEIAQDADGNIKMSMYRYLERVKLIEISRSRRKEGDAPVTPSELTQYRSLACTLMYLGSGVLP